MRISSSNLRALAVACPRCKAPAGYRCRDDGGREGNGWAHTARRVVSRAAGSDGKRGAVSPSGPCKSYRPPEISSELAALAEQHEAAGWLPWEGPDCFNRTLKPSAE